MCIRAGGHSALFCVKMSLQIQMHAVHRRIAQLKPTKAVRRVAEPVKHGWGGQVAHHRGPKIVKGLSHKILNTVKMDG